MVAKQGFKLIDALHLATAYKQGCKALVTNDQGMQSIDGVKVIHLRDCV
jgi:predicted nucleic acid-binding protein